jgi:hypothetical protein
MRRRAGLLACAALLAHGGAHAQGDVEEGERALERALTRESVLVLPKGAYELEPGVEYSYRGTDALAIVDQSGATAQVARQDVKQDRLETRLTFRAGLRGASHLELRVPYVFLRNEQSTGDQGQTDHHAGAGDVQLGFTKQLAEERPARPGLLASLTWRAPTGDFHFGEPSAGGGFHALQGALTFVKREDPLVFFGTASYTAVRGRRHDDAEIKPGNSFDMKLGTMLAASPRTSLRGAFELARTGRTEINGAAIRGSDTAVATLQLGFATLLSARTLLDIQVAIGVTRDAPDFAVTASLPFRF